MSEPDEFDLKARELVSHCRYCDRLGDSRSQCGDDHEQDVRNIAAWGRELARGSEKLAQAECDAREEIELLHGRIESLHNEINGKLAAKDAELAKLRPMYEALKVEIEHDPIARRWVPLENAVKQAGGEDG
jgi:hypothetical protein